MTTTDPVEPRPRGGASEPNQRSERAIYSLLGTLRSLAIQVLTASQFTECNLYWALQSTRDFLEFVLQLYILAAKSKAKSSARLEIIDPVHRQLA